MLVKILNSGSDGNCCVVKDCNQNQLLLDCGLGYEKIISNINLSKLNAVCLSHLHRSIRP